MTASPILRLAFGLVGLITSVFILADIVIGVIPDEHAQINVTRQVVARIATEQITSHLNAQNRGGMQITLDAIRRQYPELQATAVREEGGGLVASSGAYPAVGTAAREALDVVQAPIQSAQGLWGHVEFFYVSAEPKTWTDWLLTRRLWVPVVLIGLMVLCAALYLRRVLTYLDPMSVVPERVRTAFDSLHEGVALLDRSGHVMLANRVLRQMAAVEESKLHGRPLEEGAKFHFPAGTRILPWKTAVATAAPVLGVRVTVGNDVVAKSGSIDCSPIIDARGKVRGCLVTIADLTDLEKINDQLRVSLAELEQSKAIIETQNEELTRLALYDGLTGLLNRRAFFDAAEKMRANCLRTGTSVSVVMLDVDHFKSFNDKHGHAVGDMVLQRVAQCLQSSIRAGDICGRYGGEEFCAMLTGLTAHDALQGAERIRAYIEAHAGLNIPEKGDLTVTASLGLCTSASADMTLISMLTVADEAMYVAKRNGRNRVSSSPLPAHVEA